MPRYFLEVSYKGTNYSGFQTQKNANTVQDEIEKALRVLTPGNENLILTGSSRTDTGVHALQNFFHFDSEQQIDKWKGIDELRKFPYKMNAILPSDIVIKKLIVVKDDAHCRFDAISREYKYYIYQSKNPFLDETGYYFPYKLDMEVMHEAASLIKEYTDFTSFSKRNTQVKNFKCGILLSEWTTEDDCIVYHVKANRFLRGMVRALVATMLKLGRNKLDIEGFRNIIESQDCSKASFAVPGKGLFLVKVSYPYL